MLEVPDDSGFLALVVPATYHSFVSESWTFETIRTHFQEQMSRQSLLIWGTGSERCWRVDVRVGGKAKRGFREVSGPLTVTGGAVLLTNYESLTMAAQFDDEKLPQPHEIDQLIPLPDGNYICRIVQMVDPDADAQLDENLADFVVTLVPSATTMDAWSTIPWLSDL